MQPPLSLPTLPRPLRRLLALLPKGLLKFLAVGSVGLIVHTAVFTLALQLAPNRSSAWLMGLTVSTLAAWSLNRKHTFAASGRGRRDEMTRYALVTVLAQGVSFTVFHMALRAAPQLWPQVCVLTGAAVAAVFSYTGQRFFTFAQGDVQPAAMAAR